MFLSTGSQPGDETSRVARRNLRGGWRYEPSHGTRVQAMRRAAGGDPRARHPRRRRIERVRPGRGSSGGAGPIQRNSQVRGRVDGAVQKLQAGPAGD